MIYLAWHLGLGDAIACAAIAAKLSESDWVTVPCWKHNEVSIKSLFVNHPKVSVIVIDNDNILKNGSVIDCHFNVLRLGYYNESISQNIDEDFVQWFYRQAGMDISEKEMYCPIKKAMEKSNDTSHPQGEYAFVHSDPERGFVINRNIKPEQKAIPRNIGGSILKYGNALVNAKEVHCIDSSFIHLAESLSVTGKKFYHKYARPNSTDFKYLKGWEAIQ
jgi:hypothetical protein